MIRRAIERYHELLSGPLGRESARAFLDGARGRAVDVRRPADLPRAPAVLPRARRGARLKADAEALARRVPQAARRCSRTTAGSAACSGCRPADEAVLAADRQPFEPDQIARIDGFLVRGGPFRVIEYNAESPGGIAFGDALGRDLPRPPRDGGVRARMRHRLVRRARQHAAAALSPTSGGSAARARASPRSPSSTGSPRRRVASSRSAPSSSRSAGSRRGSSSPTSSASRTAA